jgi:hypothetical protein
MGNVAVAVADMPARKVTPPEDPKLQSVCCKDVL